MSLPLLALLFMASKESNGSRGGKKRSPNWPSTRHPPSVPRMPRMPAMPHEKEQHAHATPAEHAHAEERHVDTHPSEPHTSAAHHDSATPLHEVQHHVPPARAHVEQHHPRAQTLPPARRVRPMPGSDPRTWSPGNVAVSDAQRILVGLGWRGHLTTSGPLHPELKDGEFGPVTADDWAQSARKRGLDPTFARVGPTTAHVDRKTYETLKQVAQSKGAVIVGRIP